MEPIGNESWEICAPIYALFVERVLVRFQVFFGTPAPANWQEGTARTIWQRRRIEIIPPASIREVADTVIAD